MRSSSLSEEGFSFLFFFSLSWVFIYLFFFGGRAGGGAAIVLLEPVRLILISWIHVHLQILFAYLGKPTSDHS